MMANEKGRETLMKETLGVVRELISVNPTETATLIQSFVAPGTSWHLLLEQSCSTPTS
jgi:hypothetical protein